MPKTHHGGRSPAKRAERQFKFQRAMRAAAAKAPAVAPRSNLSGVAATAVAGALGLHGGDSVLDQCPTALERYRASVQRQQQLADQEQAAKRAQDQALGYLFEIKRRRCALEEDRRAFQDDREHARREIAHKQYILSQARFDSEDVVRETSGLVADAHAFASTLTEAAKKVSALPCDDDPRARAAKGKVVRELLSLKCRGLGASERVCERAEALEYNVEELRKAVHAINPELIGVPTSELLAGRPIYFPRKGPFR